MGSFPHLRLFAQARERPYTPSIFNRLEQTAYSRDKLNGRTFVVVGCGALGSEAARLLGLLGVARVLLVDHDTVAVTNGTHSPAFQAGHDLGRPKAIVLAEHLGAFFPGTEWVARPCAIADLGFGDLCAASLVLSCTDNVGARVETAYVTRKLALPMMDAGLKGKAFWSARVAWYPAIETEACYLCHCSASRRAELLAAPFSIAQSCSTFRDHNATLPSTPTMASITAGLQVDLGLRFALQAGDPPYAQAWNLSLPLPGSAWDAFTLTRSEECPFHSFDKVADLQQMPSHMSVRETLVNASSGGATGIPAVELDWPLCLSAQCLGCGQRSEPMVRMAVLRGMSVCAECGARSLYPVEVLSSIASASPWAAYTPHQLGLPRNHLFTLRYPLTQ